jgi:predicted metal-binding membrane protein
MSKEVGMQAPWQSTHHDERPFLVIALALIVLAWVVLFAWGISPYASYLSHEALGGALGGSQLWLAGIFAVGWTLMIIAMMLPTSLPLINVFRNVTRSRPDRNHLVLILIGGYLAIWLLFGVAVHAFDFGIHQLAGVSAFLQSYPWVFAASVFAIAGGYQFTALKYQCLDKCRSPLSFVTSYWTGKNEARNAFALGVHHGIFCVGCCWSLMLLMFVVGHANIGWMLMLGVIMGAEKNLKKGRHLAKPLGLGLLLGAVLITGVGIIHQA